MLEKSRNAVFFQWFVCRVSRKDYLSSPCSSLRKKREKQSLVFNWCKRNTWNIIHPSILTYPKYHSTYFLAPNILFPPDLTQAKDLCLVALKNSGLVRTPFPSKSICRKNCFLTGAVDLEKNKAWGEWIWCNPHVKELMPLNFPLGF